MKSFDAPFINAAASQLANSTLTSLVVDDVIVGIRSSLDCSFFCLRCFHCREAPNRSIVSHQTGSRQTHKLSNMDFCDCADAGERFSFFEDDDFAPLVVVFASDFTPFGGVAGSSKFSFAADVCCKEHEPSPSRCASTDSNCDGACLCNRAEVGEGFSRF